MWGRVLLSRIAKEFDITEHSASVECGGLGTVG
jgi:hypothetical protein